MKPWSEVPKKIFFIEKNVCVAWQPTLTHPWVLEKTVSTQECLKQKMTSLQEMQSSGNWQSSFYKARIFAPLRNGFYWNNEYLYSFDFISQYQVPHIFLPEISCKHDTFLENDVWYSLGHTLENIASSSRVWSLKPSTASVQQFYTFTVWEKMFLEILRSHFHFHFHLQCGEMFFINYCKKKLFI